MFDFTVQPFFWEIEMVRHIMIVVWSAHRKKKWMRFVCYCTTLLVYHKNALLRTKSLFMRLPWKFKVSWRKFQWFWYNSLSFDASDVWQRSEVPNDDQIQVSKYHIRTCMLLDYVNEFNLKKQPLRKIYIGRHSICIASHYVVWGSP